MTPDPILDEIRDIRRKLDAEERDHPEVFEQRLRDIQERYKDRMVSLGPKRVPPRKAVD